MDKEFVPYQPSLDLKELDFDEPCFGIFNKEGELRQSEKNNHNLSVDRYDFPIYDKKSIHYEGIRAPTYSQAFRWFRETYNMEGYVFMADCLKKTYQYHIDFTDKEDKELYSFEHIPECYVSLEYHSSYEEAELACLKKLIEIVKQQKM